MKISLNDKRVFIVLGLMGLFVVYNNFIYSGQKKDIKKYTASINTYEETSSDYDGLAQRVAGIDTELKIFNEKIKNIRSIFPPEITQDDVLILIKKFSKESGFTINNIAFSEVKEVGRSAVSSSTVATTPATNPPATSQSAKEVDAKTSGTKASGVVPTRVTPPKVITNERFLNALDSLGIAYGKALELRSNNINVEDGKGFTLGINISGTSSNNQLKDFLYKIQNFTNVAAINSVQISSNDDGLLTVGLEVEFYGIADKKAAQQAKYFDVKWTPLNPAGKNDIFKPFEGYVKQGNQSSSGDEKVNNGSQNINQQVDYDFSMRVLSFGNNMAPPTVSLLGKSIFADDSRMPIVYGDNRENEKVDLYFETKEGKYYCKFKTDHEAFPDEKYTNLAQFEPSGNDIKMLIDSSKRVSASDNAGVAITITNNSEKNLIIDVVNDDNNRPRVAINKSGNNVIINYN